MKKNKRQFRNETFDLFYDVDPKFGDGEWDLVANWCVDHVGTEDTFIDVGAYIGFMSYMVAHFSKPKRIIAIEPDPETVKILEANSYKFSTSIAIIEKAVSDAKGEAKLYKNTENPATNSFYPRYDLQHKTTIKVKQTTLDDIVEEYKIDGPIVVKIDAEFAEPLIWAGMQKSLSKVKRFIMEYQPTHLYKFTKKDPNQLVNDIKAKGFVDEVVGNNLAFYNKCI